MMMGDNRYAYAVLLAAVCGAALWLMLGRRAKLRGALMAAAVPLCAALGWLLARLYVIAARELVSGYGVMSVFSPYPFDYAMCGALLGVLLGAVLCARVFGEKAARVLDCAAPAGLLTLAIARFGEVYSDFGWGQLVEDALWQRLPFAVSDMYGMWHSAVFVLEAIAALAVLAFVMTRRGKEDGVRFALALLWLSMTQIFCESLRAETIRWGFVRVQQINCLIFALAILLVYAKKRRAGARKLGASLAVFAAGVGLLVFVEYALDKLPFIPH